MCRKGSWLAPAQLSTATVALAFLNSVQLMQLSQLRLSRMYCQFIVHKQGRCFSLLKSGCCMISKVAESVE